MKRFLSFGNFFIGIAIISLTLILIFLPNYNMLEFLNEYMLHYVLFLLFSGLIGLIIQNKFILYISFGCAFMLTLFLKYNSNTDLKLPKPNNQPTLGLIHINLSSISGIEDLQRLLKDQAYDVISFQEYTPDWTEVLEEVFVDSFPYKHLDVQLTYHGKAIFSKHSFIVKPDVILNDIEALHLELNKGGEIYQLISVYLTPPLNEKDKKANEKEIIHLTKVVSSLAAPTFVFGELNRVYWAKPVIQFRKQSLLMNSRRNAPLSFKTSYNHIFYSGDMECYHFEDVFDKSNVTIGCRGLYQKKKSRLPKRKFRKDES